MTRLLKWLGLPLLLVLVAALLFSSWLYTYQRLTERCHASLRQVQPLREAEPGRPRFDAGALKPLVALKREAG